MPACTPVEAPACTPARVPEPTPGRGSRQLFAVHDAAGVVVGMSSKDTPPVPEPLLHAIWVLRWAIASEGVRGRWTLASVLERAYRTWAKADGWDLMPWKTVATALRQFVPYEYKPVTVKGRRRKRLAYLMPERFEDVGLPPLPVNMVPIGRRRA